MTRADAEDGEEMDDRLVPRKEYILPLSAPSGFSRTTLGYLSKKIHDYMVYRALAVWLSVTAPGSSAKYAAMADEAAEGIREARFLGSGSARRPLYPF